MLKKLT